MTPPGQSTLERALGQPWYHTIEVAPGRATPGVVDLRPYAERLLPADLSGKRALDVGTFDGFWAFSLESRGAAEVVAADLETHDASDWPPLHRARLARELADTGSVPRQRFELARELRSSGVRWVGSSIYELEAERLGGTFDYAVVGALLLHLRDPVGALERLHSVLTPGAKLLSVEPFAIRYSLLPRRRAVARFRSMESDYTWWLGNDRALREWIVLAGFEAPERKATFRLRASTGGAQWTIAYEARRP